MKAHWGWILACMLGAGTVGCGGEPDTPPVEDVPSETDLGGGSDDPSAMMEDAAPSQTDEPADSETQASPDVAN